MEEYQKQGASPLLFLPKLLLFSSGFGHFQGASHDFLIHFASVVVTHCMKSSVSGSIWTE